MKNFLILLFMILTSLVYGQADRNIKTVTAELKESATPANPPTGSYKIYVKSDGQMYLLNSAGTESALPSGAAGGGVSQWLTATNYAAEDVVIESNLIYVCLNDHLSGTFATDLAALEWQAIQIEAVQTINVPAGNLAATEIQGAVNELQTDIDGRQTTLTNSAGLAAALSDESGTGLAVFGTSPAITTPTGIVKGDVGLGNVDNTSDVTKDAAATSLTNKTIDADLSTITNIENADIKAAAAIDATKLADGTVTSTELQYINTLSSNAQTQIGTKVTGPASSVDAEIMLFDSTTGKLAKSATGTGFAKVTSGVLSAVANINLAADVSTTVLPIANGGTNKALTLSAGGIAYFDGDSFEVLAAGAAGEFVRSGGAAAPTWNAGSQSADTVIATSFTDPTISCVITDSAASITEDPGDLFSSCTDADPMVCTVSLTFVTAPQCWAATVQNGVICSVTGDTVTTVTVDRSDVSTACRVCCLGGR